MYNAHADAAVFATLFLKLSRISPEMTSLSANLVIFMFAFMASMYMRFVLVKGCLWRSATDIMRESSSSFPQMDPRGKINLLFDGDRLTRTLLERTE